MKTRNCLSCFRPLCLLWTLFMVGSAMSASPADSHDPCPYHSRQNSPSTGGDNKYLFSFSPQLRPKPHPVPSDAPSKTSQKLVNILGGKFWHHNMIWVHQIFISWTMLLYCALICQCAELPASPQWPGHQRLPELSAGEWRCEQKGLLKTVQSLSQAI